MKTTGIILLVLMALCAGAFASETRTLVMGQNDGIMVDDYNMYRFPGRTFDYPNLAIGEFCAPDDFYQMGINWKFGDENPWVLATHISSLSPLVPVDYSGGSLADFDILYDQNHRIDLFYGRRLGNNNFGFSFEFVRSAQKEELSMVTDPATPTVTVEEKFSYMEFGIGLTEGSSGKWDVAANFGFGTWTDDDTLGVKETEPDGLSQFSLEGRYFWVKNPTVTLVPHAGLSFGKRGVKEFAVNYIDQVDTTLLDRTTSGSAFGFDLGLGMNYTSGQNMLAVCDLGIMYQKVSTDIEYNQNYIDSGYVNVEREQKNLSIPYIKLGFEAEVFKWMDVRLGATTYWNIDKNELQTVLGSSSSTTNWANNDTYMGFGLHWGNLYIDTYTDPELILDGFNFISGSDDVEDMNAMVSVTYEMF